MIMDRSTDIPPHSPKPNLGHRWLEELCDMEAFFGKHGCSEFEYDESLDLFRFAEDGRFAFCREFADWERLRQSGYLPKS